ncbi:hypothetical protein F4808DRAFT_409747 [Astrocystis sublimbata]|nr:hypothetical protein F4808DRAFT_409747 [Astrocystis sublimbata]
MLRQAGDSRMEAQRKLCPNNDCSDDRRASNEPPPAYELAVDGYLLPREESDEVPPAYDFTQDGHPPSEEKCDITTTNVEAPVYSHASGSASSVSTSKPSSSTSLFTAIKQKHNRKKKGKEIEKKVDLYERIYGFVPKNVMTEDEWRRAREAAPKTKKKGGLKATPFMGPR